jgi:hypothetical protein
MLGVDTRRKQAGSGPQALAAQLAGAKHRYEERTALDRSIFREDYEV